MVFVSFFFRIIADVGAHRARFRDSRKVGTKKNFFWVTEQYTFDVQEPEQRKKKKTSDHFLRQKVRELVAGRENEKKCSAVRANIC